MIASVSGLSEVFACVEKQAQRLVPHDELELLLFDEGSGRAPIKYSTRSRFQAVSLDLGSEALESSWFALTGRDVLLVDRPASRISVPLRAGGRITGLLVLSCEKPGVYNWSHIAIVEKLADVVALALDHERLSEKVRAAAERAAAMRGMEEGAEEERRRLAMDLHDQTLGDLGTLASRAENLARTRDYTIAESKAQFAELATGLRTALAELRHLTEELHPASLDVFGLPAAIEGALGRAAARSRFGFQPAFVDHSMGVTVDMPPFHRRSIYRIVQEALNNAAAHSGADRVEVSLAFEAGALFVRVADDGRGFDPKLIRPGALGLHTMRHRAALIGASIDWLSRGQVSGCLVSLRVPIDQAVSLSHGTTG